MEQKHHLTNRDDVFLCIPPLYHTGAKFHWMGTVSYTHLAIAAREKKIVHGFKNMLGIKVDVSILEPKTITRSEGKAVRVVDKRNLYNK